MLETGDAGLNSLLAGQLMAGVDDGCAVPDTAGQDIDHPGVGQQARPHTGTCTGSPSDIALLPFPGRVVSPRTPAPRPTHTWPGLTHIQDRTSPTSPATRRHARPCSSTRPLCSSTRVPQRMLGACFPPPHTRCMPQPQPAMSF